jgi:hypothetical protein
MYVAMDSENGQAFGPFDSRDEAEAWIVAVLISTGEIDDSQPQGRETGDAELAGDMGFFAVEVTMAAPSEFRGRGVAS